MIDDKQLGQYICVLLIHSQLWCSQTLSNELFCSTKRWGDRDSFYLWQTTT